MTSGLLNPLKWRVLTWVFFLLWLALSALAQAPVKVISSTGTVREMAMGWPFQHTQVSYSPNPISGTSVALVVVDLLLVLLVLGAVVAVGQRSRFRLSVRSLLLSSTLVAILIVCVQQAVRYELFQAIIVGAEAVYFLPVVVWLGAILLRKMGFIQVLEIQLSAAVAAALLMLALVFTWEYIPGTFYRDGNGRAWGTGRETFEYDSGALMLESWYLAGVLQRTTWYRPDGTEIASSTFDTRRGGVGYFLRQDGSVRMVMYCRYDPEGKDYIAHGMAVHYAPDGSIERAEEYRDGVRVAED